MSVLVVGGAGYIGAHVVRLLREEGTEVVVIDNLSTSQAERVGDVPLVEIDISLDGATEKIAQVLRDYNVDSVIHFAAKKRVGESVENPLYYYRQNLCSMISLLEAMQAKGVRNMIFSSSVAVYGAPDEYIVREDAPTEPINPYGRTKLVGEWVLGDCERAWGLNWIALRYFNVAGAGWSDLGDSMVLTLVPMVLDRLAQGEEPRIFGDDYDTPDGTCIRDFVHVKDVAAAHIVALRALAGKPSHRVYNVGTGKGSSVKEVISAIEEVSGIAMQPVVEPRRAGDPPKMVAIAERIDKDLGFKAEAGLPEIVASSWDAWQVGPKRIER